MDMSNVNFGSDGFFGAMPQKASGGVSVDGCGLVPDQPVQLDGFAAILSEKSASQSIDFAALIAGVTPDALNVEAAFSSNQIVGEDESLLSKIESLEDIDALLKRVGALLGLQIDMEKSLYNVDPEKIPDEMVSQLADFLGGLKDFSQLLQKTAEANVSVEIAGEEIQGGEVLSVARSLNSEIMKLEISCSKLDISGRMAIMSAIQNRQPVQSGVQFAVNPKDLAGTQKIPEALAALFNKEENELEGLIGAIRQLAASSAKPEMAKLGNSATEKVTPAMITPGMVASLEPKEAAAVLKQMEPAKAVEILTTLEPEEAAKVLTAMESNQAAAVLNKMEPAKATEILKTMEPIRAAEVVKILDSTAAIMNGTTSTAIIEETVVAEVVEVVAPGQKKTTVTIEKVTVVAEKGQEKSAKELLAGLVPEVVTSGKAGDKRSSKDNKNEQNQGAIPVVSATISADLAEIESVAFPTLESDIESVVTVDSKADVINTDTPVVKTEKVHTPRTFERVVVDQVSAKLADSAKNGVREVTLVLKPELLGQVKITLQVEGDLVSAKLLVESQQVKQIVESNLQNLKDSLAEQGLRAGSLDVNVGSGENRHAEDPRKSNRRKSGIPGSVDEFESDPFVPDLFGKETGRRFGTNSVEYFA